LVLINENTKSLYVGPSWVGDVAGG